MVAIVDCYTSDAIVTSIVLSFPFLILYQSPLNLPNERQCGIKSKTILKMDT